MSVINQMLRDLEQRREKTTASTHYIDEVNIIARNKPLTYIGSVLGVLVLLVFVLGYFVMNYLQPETEQKQLSDSAPLIADLPVNLPDNNVHISQTELLLENNIRPEPEPEPELEFKSKPEPVVNRIKPVPDKHKITKRDSGIVTETDISAEQSKAPVKQEKKNLAVKKPVITARQHSITIKNKKSEPQKLVMDSHKTQAKYKIERINKKAMEHKKTDLMLHARMLMNTDLKSAIVLLEKNMDVVKADADYYSLLANLYQRQQRYDDAIVSYRKALELTPQSGSLWIGIALAYRSNGEFENERQAFQSAVTSTHIRAELRQYAIEQLQKIAQRK